MIKDQIFAKLDSIKGISSPPTILKEILGLINDQDVSNKDLADIILKDPSITVRLLKIANSSYYGVSRDITSVNQAIMVIGLKAVKYFILSISVFSQVSAKKDKSNLDQKQLWTHFLETAVTSRKIAEHINYELPDEVYVAGLLHDIGLILLESNFPDEYGEVLNYAKEGEDLCQAEKKVFGVDHQEVAEYVSQKWNMPKKLHEPLCKHHLNSEEDIEKMSTITKIVCLADSIAQVPFDDVNNLYSAEKRLISLNMLSETLNIDAKTLIEIHMRLAGEVVTSANDLDLDMGDAIDILTQSNTKLFNIYIELSSLFKERQELSRKMLVEERTEGALESLKISLATLSHYLNNATMNIQGKCDILRMFYDKKDVKTLIRTLPTSLSSMQKSTQKISLMLEELSNISSLENLNFFNNSRAIDIENDLKAKLAEKFETVEVN
ncbi:MAG: HDOD domain-containing protein [candidate division Zixibacteria bacterium]|nr:HDOD domain-containing protein [candidate division Zixibacteria bacterium]